MQFITVCRNNRTYFNQIKFTIHKTIHNEKYNIDEKNIHAAGSGTAGQRKCNGTEW